VVLRSIPIRRKRKPAEATTVGFDDRESEIRDARSPIRVLVRENEDIVGLNITMYHVYIRV
jgi:hypothetical protein